MKKLFLDDCRVPKDAFAILGHRIYLEDGWDVVRSYNEFVAHIEKNGLPDLVSFDHDLADEHYADGGRWIAPRYDEYAEKTGYHCAKWLAQKCYDEQLPLPRILAHTMNPVGRNNIIEYMTWSREKINELINNNQKQKKHE